MKRIIIIICCFMFFPFQALTASARGRLENLVVKSSGLPKEAVYIDMLISMDENDEAYTPFNEENMKQYSFDTKAIAEYNSEGFLSMSCHYKDNFTKMEIQYEGKWSYHNSFTLHKYSDGSLASNPLLVSKLLREDRQFCIALLDKNGNIIQLSKPFKGNCKKGPLINYIGYDAKNNTLSLDYEHDGEPLWWVRAINPLYLIIGIVIFIFIIKFLISRFRHRHNNVE